MSKAIPLTVVFVATLAAVVVVAGIPGKADEFSVNVSGSSTIAPIIAEIAKNYEKENTNVKVNVQTGGSSKGISDVVHKMSDIGMVSRDISAPEERIKVTTLGRDGIAIIVNEQNKVGSLSDKQIEDIYTGKIGNWNELMAGVSGDIVVVSKAEGRATLDVFLNYFKLKPSNIKADIIIGENLQGVKTVAGNPNAIGFVSIGTAYVEKKRGSKIRLLPINGVEPSIENVSNGSYPLNRSLNLLSDKLASPAVESFLTYAVSPKSYSIIEGLHFVPVKN